MTITITISSLKLTDRTAFVKAVIARTTTTTTYREAYEKIEEEYFKLFGRNRYANYETFRNAKHRVQKPRTPKVQINQLSLF
jgi:hypothetical protein